MNSRIVLMIFDIIIMGISLVLLYHALTMKKTKEMPDLLIDENDMKRCKKGKEAEFVLALQPKLFVFSVVGLIAGAAGLVSGILHKGAARVVFVVALLVFLAVWTWFTAGMRKLKDKYLKAM
ncbi:MAG: hypothetical protein PUG16_08315 [Lachnospiraceae bacterium]|jgi:hypothetical protein|nr:hypothetical protein [Lachnospiraceae bacterium]